MSNAEFEYDVALSFAGEDRAVVEPFAVILKSQDLKVFYDSWEQANLWGRDLYQHLDEVYSKKARFCVVFLSSNYAAKAWTNHELKSAQARAFEENDEYILPLRLDDTEIPGIRPTLGYLDLKQVKVEDAAQIAIEKIVAAKSRAERGLRGAGIEKETQIEASNSSATSTNTPGSVEASAAATALNGGKDTPTMEWRFFAVGVGLLVVAIIMAFWGFGLEELQPHQASIMKWLFPLASGFAAGAFVGSFTVTGKGGWIPGIVVTATGGFGVWLMTHFLVFNEPTHRPTAKSPWNNSSGSAHVDNAPSDNPPADDEPPPPEDGPPDACRSYSTSDDSFVKLHVINESEHDVILWSIDWQEFSRTDQVLWNSLPVAANSDWVDDKYLAGCKYMVVAKQDGSSRVELGWYKVIRRDRCEARIVEQFFESNLSAEDVLSQPKE